MTTKTNIEISEGYSLASNARGFDEMQILWISRIALTRRFCFHPSSRNKNITIAGTALKEGTSAFKKYNAMRHIDKFIKSTLKKIEEK